MANGKRKSRTRQPNHAGSIYQEKARSGYVAAVTRENPETGKRECMRKRCKTWDDAQKALEDLHIEFRTGYIPAPERMTVSMWLDRWQARANALAPATKAYYRGVIEKHIKPHIGSKLLAAVTAPQIESLYATMLDKKLHRYVCAAHATLRKALNDAVRLGALKTNPMSQVNPPPTPRRVEEFLDKAQILAFLAQLENEPTEIRALGTLGIFTGMRFGELLGVSWDDVDLKERTLYVQLQLQRQRQDGAARSEKKKDRKPNAPVRVPLKNAKSARILVLSQEVVAALEAEQTRQSTAAFPNPLRLVLLNPQGRPWDQKDANLKLKAVCERAGVPGYGPHKLFRHSFITLLLKEGQTLHDASRIAGHSDPRLTGALYGHHSTEATRRTMDAASQALREQKRKDEEKRTAQTR